jgi:hypothetical protein
MTPEAQNQEGYQMAGGKEYPRLGKQIATLPLLKTPSSVETEGGVMEIRSGADAHYKLRDQIAMLRTPSGQEPGVDVERLVTKAGEPAKMGERAYDRTTGRLAQVGLVQQIAMLPTPKARDWKGGQGTDTVRMEHDLDKKIGTSRGLKLHSDFVAWMMNYPVDWLDISEQPKPTSKSGTKTGCKS